MCDTSLESLCIQLAKNGLIWTFCLSSSQRFKVEYTCTRVTQSTMKKIKSGSTVTANRKKDSFVHVNAKGEVLPNLNNI